MTSTVTAVVALLAAGGAGFYAWQQMHALSVAKADLDTAKAQLEKAQADVKTMQEQTEALRKEAADAKIAADEARSELNNARIYLQAEKEAGLRLREELNQARQLLASAGRATPRPVAGMEFVPSLVVPRPLRVESAGRGAAIGAAVPAR